MLLKSSLRGMLYAIGESRLMMFAIKWEWSVIWWNILTINTDALQRSMHQYDGHTYRIVKHIAPVYVKLRTDFFTSFCFWDRLQNDLLCVGWDVKPCFTPSHENICYKYNAIRNDQLTTSCSCERYLSNSNNEVRMPWMQRPICFRISEHFKKLGPFLAIKMGGVTKLKSILLVRNAEKSKRALNR